MSPLAELHRSLDEALVYGPTWNGRLSNHLPMVLHAAWELGAEAERLQAQLDHEAPRLERAEPDALNLRIAAEIEAEGAEAVLRRRVPELISMPHAGLFHGMIRTAHAWEGGHAGELAAALSYWTDLWQPQPEVAMSDEPWRETRQRLIERALDAYLRSGNFYVLHLITGLRAMRVLARFVPDVPQVSAWLERGFEAGWQRGNPRLTLEAPAQGEAPAWPRLRQAALAQLDDHAIKLVHACWQEDRLRPDRRWAQAAALALG
jgi:hypothetical protein